MRRYLLSLSICALMLSSCLSVQDYARLEERVATLEKAKITEPRDPMLLAEQAGARNFWWRRYVTGGTDALDGISHTSLADGDAAFVMYQDGSTMTAYLYIYYSSGTDAETADYRVIAPNSGGGRWYLVNFTLQQITSVAVDGTHYFRAWNSVAFSGTPAEGMCYWKDTASNENHLCCYDADAPAWKCIDWDTGAPP